MVRIPSVDLPNVSNARYASKSLRHDSLEHSYVRIDAGHYKAACARSILRVDVVRAPLLTLVRK
jgi:hypothetical protein